MKRLAELDQANGGLKESTKLVADQKIATITESALDECGMPGMPGAPTSPASFSINASAASGDEVASMLTQIMTLAGMPGGGQDKGVIPPEMDGDKGPLTGEPPMGGGGNDIKAALDAIDQAEQPAGFGGEEEGEMGTEMGTAGPAGGDVGTMADQVRDMADQLSGTSKDELGLESLRQFDNSPQEHTREYNPNDFANILNKVRDFETVPARGGDNPLKQESIEQSPAKEETSLLDITNNLFKEYNAFKNQ